MLILDPATAGTHAEAWYPIGVDGSIPHLAPASVRREATRPAVVEANARFHRLWRHQRGCFQTNFNYTEPANG